MKFAYTLLMTYMGLWLFTYLFDLIEPFPSRTTIAGLVQTILILFVTVLSVLAYPVSGLCTYWGLRERSYIKAIISLLALLISGLINYQTVATLPYLR